MSEIWEHLTAFLHAARQGGDYYGLILPAFFYCMIEDYNIVVSRQENGYKAVKRKLRKRWIPVSFLIYFVLFMNPLTALLFRRITGQEYSFSAASLLIPTIPFLAYACVRIVSANITWKFSKRMAVTVGLSLAIMAAGTMIPWLKREDLSKTSSMNYGRQDAMVQSLLQASEELGQSGDIPYLAAPKGIMEVIRRYDGSILLAYGRNLWQTQALTYLHEQYTAEQIVLCQRMEDENADAAEVAELALELGCNMIVCKKQLTDTFTEYYGLSLYAQHQGLYLYVRG